MLPLLEQSLVPPGWISLDQFLAGYGAAQAVPGPMFSFAAFLGRALGIMRATCVPAGDDAFQEEYQRAYERAHERKPTRKDVEENESAREKRARERKR